MSTQLPAGCLAVIVSPSKIFGLSIMSSSLLFMSLALLIPQGEMYVFVIRTLQGMIEGFNYPALNKVLSAWSPQDERTRIVTTVYAGSYLSPALAMFVSGATTCYVSWHSALFLYGGSGILVSLVWLIFVKDSPYIHPSITDSELQLYPINAMSTSSSKSFLSIPWCSILRSLPVSAIAVGSFCRSWVFAMILTEVPQYFADAYGLNVSTIGFIAAFPPVAMTAVTLLGGTTVDKLIQKEYVSVTIGRKLSQALGFGVEAICIMSLGFVNDYRLALIILSFGEGVSGLAISGFKVNQLDLAPRYVSIITGLTRLSSVGSSLSTAVAGALREKDIESWQRIFLIAGSLHIFGVIYYVIFASGNIQSWANEEKTIAETSSQLNLAATDENDRNYGTNGETKR
ncbi:hypothetical protein FSP39_022213 [Pinctada imbricata]|uniref:Major facilitator superfamily (MFS) profile domain-containing protein n=1 Tax=Pinctada imbricata TaxID=66713 RepID=A0AA89C498_PINIB|nr:hypothetical protein FSP39_022213 [Pinctada imbricata]